MRFSVALCTYNGEKYIEEQLSSILNQSQKVDEIVVCDDGSTDRTVDIVRNISKTNNNVHIRLYINKQNLGVCTNFEKAICLSNGDIIFLSDQDDIWNPNKVETIVNWFDKNPDKSVVFTDADLIDSKGERLIENKTLWDFTGFSKKIQQQFDEGYGFELIAAQNRCTGATMALRKNFVFDFSKYCNRRILQDDVIAVAASMHDKLGYIADRLIQYRIHERQIAGIDMSGVLIIDKYAVNSKSEFYVGMNMPSKMKKRLNFFILRAGIPKKAIVKLFRYLSVYGFSGIAFWWHDFMKLAVQIVKHKSK